MRKRTPIAIDIGLDNGPLLLDLLELLGLGPAARVVVALHQFGDELVMGVEVVEGGAFVHLAEGLADCQGRWGRGREEFGNSELWVTKGYG